MTVAVLTPPSYPSPKRGGTIRLALQDRLRSYPAYEAARIEGRLRIELLFERAHDGLAYPSLLSLPETRRDDPS